GLLAWGEVSLLLAYQVRLLHCCDLAYIQRDDNPSQWPLTDAKPGSEGFPLRPREHVAAGLLSPWPSAIFRLLFHLLDCLLNARTFISVDSYTHTRSSAFGYVASTPPAGMTHASSSSGA